MTINKTTHPVGSRLLVAWMIRCGEDMLRSAWGDRQETKVPRWTENDAIAEIRVEEYSPSGLRVRVLSSRDNEMHSPSGGWYPCERIVVKEVLP